MIVLATNIRAAVAFALLGILLLAPISTLARCSPRDIDASTDKLADEIRSSDSGSLIKDAAKQVAEHAKACIATATSSKDGVDYFGGWYLLGIANIAYATGDAVDGNLSDARDELKPAMAIANRMIAAGKDAVEIRKIAMSLKNKATTEDDLIRKAQARQSVK